MNQSLDMLVFLVMAVPRINYHRWYSATFITWPLAPHHYNPLVVLIPALTL